MLIADTNVLSELMRPQPSPDVLAWFNSALEKVYTTSVTRAEIMVGIAMLPKGRRRDTLREAATRLFEDDFGELVLSFDTRAADEFARIVALRRHLGRPVQTFDAQIAGIVAAKQATLVTRNVADFTGCGFEVINPWQV